MYTQVFAFAIDSRPSVLPPGAHMYLAAGFLALGAVLATRYLILQRTRPQPARYETAELEIRQ